MNSNEYIQYYQCGNFHYKGLTVCKSNLVRADEAEQHVFNRLEQITADKTYLLEIINNVNAKVANIKTLLKEQFQYLDKEITNIKNNIEKYCTLFEDDIIDSSILKNKITQYEHELAELKMKQSEIEIHLKEPSWRNNI